jgi:hypothetical protein
MAVGFYCTVVRAAAQTGGMFPIPKRVGWLLGPYDDEATARAKLPDARRLAEAADPFTAFDAFGTARLERDGDLPPGVLNTQLEN